MKPISDHSSNDDTSQQDTGPKRSARGVVHTFYAENDDFQRLISERIQPHINRARSLPDNLLNPELARKLVQDGKDLSGISMHYRRKEELLFPQLQKHGEEELPRTMWNHDDEVRQYLALAVSLIAGAVNRPSGSNLESAADQLDLAASEAEKIIQQENRELFPLALQKLSEAEWQQIAVDSADYGLTPQDRPTIWVSPIERAEAAVRRAFRDGVPQATASEEQAKASSPESPEASADAMPKVDLSSTNPNRPAPCLTSGPGIGRHEKSQGQPNDAHSTPEEPEPTRQHIALPTGSFDATQLEAVLDALPLDVTFVDASDTMRFFSHGNTSAFPRSRDDLGLSVASSYPPEHQSLVRKILAEFRAGERNQYEFWTHHNAQYLFVRFVALRDEKGTYLGALETTQDIAPLQHISGENTQGANEHIARNCPSGS